MKPLPSAGDERAILRAFRRTRSAAKALELEFKDLRRCPRCGGPLSWRRPSGEDRRRRVCSDCGLVHYQNPKIVAATLPSKGRRVALLRRAIEPAFGKWTYPAGYMELGETVEEAARRETREEIRARLGPLGPPMIYSYPDASVVTIVYAARIAGGGLGPGPEALEVRLFSPEEIPWSGLAFRSTYHALKDWVRAVGRARGGAAGRVASGLKDR